MLTVIYLGIILLLFTPAALAGRRETTDTRLGDYMDTTLADGFGAVYRRDNAHTFAEFARRECLKRST